MKQISLSITLGITKGIKNFEYSIFEDQQVDIIINPNGNLDGPVSVELIPIKINRVTHHKKVRELANKEEKENAQHNNCIGINLVCGYTPITMVDLFP